MNTIAVPLVNLSLQYEMMQFEINLAVKGVLASGQYVMSSQVESFEEEFAEYCGAKYCVGLGSCTEALTLTLKALWDGQSIITTPFTFYATTLAIIQSGNHPRFVDVGEDGNLPPRELGFEQPAVPVHLYGKTCHVKGELVVEDAAQAHGKKVSGMAACFSFYPTKNLGAVGQAGAMVTNNEWLYTHVRKMRTYNEGERFVHKSPLTGNHRMDELQAAILRVKLKHLVDMNVMRRYWARTYNSLLGRVGDVIHLPEITEDHVFHCYAIRCQSRGELQAWLASKGIQTSVRYPIPMHLQPSLSYLGHKPGDFPNAEKWANEVLTLPMYPELSYEQVERVADGVKGWVDEFYNR